MVEEIRKKSLYQWWIVLGILAFAGGRILYYLIVYGDIYPHWDEWKYVPAKGGIWEHLFAYNNENLQFFTNFQFWLVEKTGLSYKSNVFISYGIYLLLVCSMYRFLRKYVTPFQRWGLLLSFAPLFADYMLDNLLWPILSQTWWYLLFMLMAVYFGFDREQNLSFRVKSAIMILCSVLAMNISFIILFSLCYLLKNIYNASNKKSELLFAGIWLECLSIVLFVFCVKMRASDTTVIDWKALLSAAFYERFFYVFTAPLSGFFIKPEEHAAAVILGIILLCWLMFLFAKQFALRERQGIWALAIILGGNLAAITLFRGDLVYYVTDHAGRYLPFVFFLVPVLFTFGCCGNNRLLIRLNYVLVLTIFLCTLGGQFNQRYKQTLERIASGRACIETYYQSSPRPSVYFCGNNFGKNLSPYLEDFEKVFLLEK